MTHNARPTASVGAAFSLLAMLLAASCVAGAGQGPTAPPEAAPASLAESAQIVGRALGEERPELLRRLIGDEGVAAAPFAVGAQFAGHDNSDEIVALFSEALGRGRPACLGYDPEAGTLPDKAMLIYRGLAIDWSRLGLEGVESDGMTIQLFKLPEGWRMVYITPFDLEAGASYLGSLQDCP
jgi:hypothetical protein